MDWLTNTSRSIFDIEKPAVIEAIALLSCYVAFLRLLSEWISSNVIYVNPEDKLA